MPSIGLPIRLINVSRCNANAALVFEYCYRFISIAKSYFGKVDEEAVKNNFVLIYELIDGNVPDPFFRVAVTQLRRDHRLRIPAE